MVGPFIFFDQMGPAEFLLGQGIDVRPHPHIGLATVTYLFDGEIIHRDSLGTLQPIRPGAVNWMTAGRGIAHSERTAKETRTAGARLFGIQTWVALPKHAEETEPGFSHHVARTACRLMLLGGEPMDGPRHIWWNFVSSSKDRVEQAKADWKAGRFTPVSGDLEFIPLPE
jgi:redox-sensitive bicupin YhaK (pirin superfamily)